MEISDLVYAACAIDCEGTIAITTWSPKNSRVYCGLHVAVYMTEFEVPTWLFKTFGGSFFSYHPKQTNRKVVYCWHLSGKKAANFLHIIFPYFKMKRNQAEVALAFQSLKRDKSGGRTPQVIYEAQLILRDKLKKLHHKNEKA